MTLVLVTASALISSTGGFATTSLERSVAVQVSSNDRAYVTIWDPGVGSRGRPPGPIASQGLAGEDPVTGDGKPVRIVAVLNRFSRYPIRVNATAVSTPPGLDVGPFRPIRLGPGEAGELEAAVFCGDHSGPVEVTLVVDARSARVSSTITYTAVVTCATPTPTGSSQTPDESSQTPTPKGSSTQTPTTTSTTTASGLQSRED
ncbi:MAG: hypothetical protein ABEI96_04140 [Haloarculaceae archaeon]